MSGKLEKCSTPGTSVVHQNDLQCYINPNHCSKTIEELSNKPKDCVISFQETNIEIHRSVMSLVSSYFEASVRFGNAVEDSDESSDKKITIELDNMNVEAVRALIDYAYTGEIYFAKKSALEILKSADFFCMNSISESYGKYLVEVLEYEEVSELVKISKKIREENYSMYIVITLFTAQNFSLFFQTKDFINFDAHFLQDVLSHDKLVVMEELVCGDKTEFYFTTPARQEEIVLKCVIQYVQHVKDNSILPRLVKKCVRLALISHEVRDKFQEEEPISSCSRCLDLYKLAKNISNSSDPDFKKWHTPRDLKDVLIISWTDINGESCNEKSDEDTRKITQKGIDVAAETKNHTYRNAATKRKCKQPDYSDLITELCPVIYVTKVKTYNYRDCMKGHTAGMDITYSNGMTVGYSSRRLIKYSETFGSGNDDERIFAASRSSLRGLIGYCKFRTNKDFRYDRRCDYEIPKPHPSACLAFIKGGTNKDDEFDQNSIKFGWIYNRKMATHYAMMAKK